MTNNLGRFRLSVTDAPDAAADPVPAAVREILAVPRDRRIARAGRAVFAYWRTTVPEWKAENDRIEALWKDHPAGATTLVLQARAEPRMTSILKRGDFLKPAKAVDARASPRSSTRCPADAPPTRLTLREVAGRPQSPTTARAFVNRAWQAYFGTGLVATSEDLGTQAEAPSHPELLDWLAVRVHGRRLERQGAPSADRRPRRPIGSRARSTPETPGEGPVQPAPGPGAAAPGRGRGRPRHPARRQRPAEPGGRRQERDAARARVPVPAAGQLRPVPLDRGRTGPDRYRRARLHLAEAVDALPDARDLRRARGEHLVRPPDPLEHAAPGAHDPERDARRGGRPGPRPPALADGGADRRRAARLRLPPLRRPRPRPTPSAPS